MRHPTERDRTTATQVVHPPLFASGSTLGGGRYTLERRLGHGGMAAVWLAHDLRLDRPVAAKVLSDTLAGDDEFLARFRREARVAAGLSHPNLVSVYDFDAGGERPYLVMEYVPGGDLGKRLEAGQPPDDLERLAGELLDALRHIHSAGVVHRDVKPSNVLIGEDGRAQLTDFGIAQPRDATSITQTGKVLGTESYIAPEVMRGEPPSERSDLYSLGVVLAEAAHQGVSFGVWELIDDLRAADPDERPASALAALAELERRRPTEPIPGEPTRSFDPEPPVPEPPASVPPGLGPPEGPQRAAGFSPANRRAVLGLLAAAAVAVAVIVGLALGGGDDQPGSGAKQASQGAASGGGAGASDRGSETSTTEQTETSPPAETAPTGAELNDQGYALSQDGRYEEAIPVLQQAVTALEGSGDELTYGYALFNLAHALRLAGRPDEAISLLEQRLQIPNQTGTVQAELDAARREAAAAGGTAAPKPGKKPKEPPGQAKKEEEGD